MISTFWKKIPVPGLALGVGLAFGGLGLLAGCSRAVDPARQEVAPGLYTVELPVEAPNFGVVEVLEDQGQLLRVRVDGQLDEARAEGVFAEELNSRPRSHIQDWGAEEDLWDKSILLGLSPQPMR